MTEQTVQGPEFHAREIRKFALVLGLAAAFLAALPVLLGYLTDADGYLPFHLSLDDHMVYAAWMRQAMDGQFLFDNRFTTDAQPGLTLHLYFLPLGWIAKLVGIPLALTLARIAFSFLAVRMLGEFLVRLGLPSFVGKFGMVTAVFGGGVAFLNWHTFGDAYSRGPSFLLDVMHGRQPIDNWQPEAFAFPSMLTNGLFMASLCLILWTLNCVLDARTSWKPVLPGAIAFGLLMNVHSYDVLLVALVLVAFVASLFASKQFDGKWTLRAVVIGLGAVPAALWFLKVLAEDAVFKARAETLTFTTGFVEIFAGILPLLLLAALAIARSDHASKRKFVGGSLLLVLILFLFMTGKHGGDTFALSRGEWGVAFVLAIAATAALAKKDLAWNLLWAWATVSLVAPYFPALFQRKLSMMLAVPWAILAAIALAAELKRMERQPRNLVAAVALAVICLTSVFWLRRDLELLRLGVSKTAVHNLHLTRDEKAIVDLLDETGHGGGAVALPGIPAPGFDQAAFLTDLSPVLSGLAGVHTYAGHWSETPNYMQRRNEVTRFYTQDLSDPQRLAMLRAWKVEFVVAPIPSAYEGLFPDLRGLGEVLYEGEQLALVRVRQK